MTQGKTLTIRSAPHLVSGQSVDQIMFHVVLALLPVCAFAIYAFGLAALATLATAVASCVATEHLTCLMSSRTSARADSDELGQAGCETTIGDWSATVTGLLYGLTLPPGLALWMVAVGGIFAIGIGKMLFGGLGGNPFNPALVGRALLQATFPTAMTTWPPMPADRFTDLPTSSLAWPFTKPQYDVITGATPLASWKLDRVATETTDLFLGTISGSTGETSAVLILLGGGYLVARRMMSWQIPLAILTTVACCSIVLRWIDPDRYPGPVFMMFSGGLMLGAVFMATDPVGSPMTQLGCTVYGILIGLLVVTIRLWGGMPEGVMYAILLSNAASPHIDNWTQPRVYGTSNRRGPHD